jgi:signal transduction histidine kinase
LSARDQKILGSIVDGIAIINEDGIVENTNDAFTRFTKIDPHTIKGKHINEFDDHPVLKNVFSSSPKGELNFDGRLFTLTEVPVVSEKGDKLLCSLRMLHDATDEKLSAAIEMAGATAHEVRQPLSIVISMADLVKEKIRKGEGVSEEIAVFEQQCKRINDIISRMLNITHYKTKNYTEDTKIFDL